MTVMTLVFAGALLMAVIVIAMQSMKRRASQPSGTRDGGGVGSWVYMGGDGGGSDCDSTDAGGCDGGGGGGGGSD